MNQEEARPKRVTEIQRRVAGVLVEKAKTTPEQYPLSLNGLTTGCNQKSNRSPVMNLDAEDVQITLDELRDLGAVVEVQSGGRVPKFKHLMYEWLGVDKVEMAVVAELLLRGEQTVGELRARAARMEPIPDLQTLRPILQSLVQKRLVVELTPEGRGHTVTHGLGDESELAALKSQAREARVPAPASASPSHSALDQLREQLEQLSSRVAALEARVGTMERSGE